MAIHVNEKPSFEHPKEGFLDYLSTSAFRGSHTQELSHPFPRRFQPGFRRFLRGFRSAFLPHRLHRPEVNDRHTVGILLPGKPHPRNGWTRLLLRDGFLSGPAVGTEFQIILYLRCTIFALHPASSSSCFSSILPFFPEKKSMNFPTGKIAFVNIFPESYCNPKAFYAILLWRMAK